MFEWLGATMEIPRWLCLVGTFAIGFTLHELYDYWRHG
jgi:hypothetical protein